MSAALKSSDLLGVFLAGLAFSNSSILGLDFPCHYLPFIRWGSALFFSATVGFGVPKVRTLVSRSAVVLGLVFSIVAVIGKFSVGIFAQPFTVGEVLIFGAAMNGRGEFSFLIAEEAVSEEVVDEVFGAGAVWGIVVATLLSPVMFRAMLSWEGKT